MDTTNDLKALKILGLVCRILVDVQGQYWSWNGKKNKKQKDSLVDLPKAIITPYYKDMKNKCNKDKIVWHKAWVKILDEDHLKHAAKQWWRHRPAILGSCSHSLAPRRQRYYRY
ncbi:putative ubiquitin-conjugating enzyme E2 26 [Hordeum vulgare]|nr:putative ubiquitin-conjugating enzyme E2 26 [Hordeum vulgare]